MSYLHIDLLDETEPVVGRDRAGNTMCPPLLEGGALIRYRGSSNTAYTKIFSCILFADGTWETHEDVLDPCGEVEVYELNNNLMLPGRAMRLTTDEVLKKLDEWAEQQNEMREHCLTETAFPHRAHEYTLDGYAEMVSAVKAVAGDRSELGKLLKHTNKTTREAAIRILGTLDSSPDTTV